MRSLRGCGGGETPTTTGSALAMVLALVGEAIGISSSLQSSIVEVILADERKMRARLKHTMGIIYFMREYASTECVILKRWKRYTPY